MKLSFKKNPIEYKQPQELYCSNFNCLGEVANEGWSAILDSYGQKYSNMFCLECITERKVK